MTSVRIQDQRLLTATSKCSPLYLHPHCRFQDACCYREIWTSYWEKCLLLVCKQTHWVVFRFQGNEVLISPRKLIEQRLPGSPEVTYSLSFHCLPLQGEPSGRVAHAVKPSPSSETYNSDLILPHEPKLSSETLPCCCLYVCAWSQ